MKKTVVLLLSCLLMSVIYSEAGAMEPQRWKIGHVRPAGSTVDKDIRRLVEQIKSETGGAIEIDIYPGNKLGDYSVVQERVAFGEVEMYVGPFGTAIDKRVSLAFAPFLVSTWEQARQVYSHDSPLIKQMAAFLEPQNIHLIGGWPVYFGGIGLAEKPVQPGNPDIAKELIIRVPPIRSFERTARELGYTPYPITWTYAKMGLKTGMVKGILGGGAEGYLGLKGIIKYYVPIKDHFEYWFVYMNRDVWRGLSDRQRSIIANAARDMEVRRYAVAEADEQASMAKLAAQGGEIISLDDAQRSRINEKIKKRVWPELRNDIGPAFDRVVKTLPSP